MTTQIKPKVVLKSQFKSKNETEIQSVLIPSYSKINPCLKHASDLGHKLIISQQVNEHGTRIYGSFKNTTEFKTRINIFLKSSEKTHQDISILT